MTGGARDVTEMLLRIDLREACVLAIPLHVAGQAERAWVERLRFWFEFAARMFREGAVTGFAIDVRVPAVFLRLDDIAMADGACFVAGEADRPCANLIECSGAIEAVQPEIRWHQHLSNDQKDEEPKREDRADPNDVLVVPRLSWQESSPVARHLCKRWATQHDVAVSSEPRRGYFRAGISRVLRGWLEGLFTISPYARRADRSLVRPTLFSGFWLLA